MNKGIIALYNVTAALYLIESLLFYTLDRELICTKALYTKDNENKGMRVIGELRSQHHNGDIT